MDVTGATLRELHRLHRQLSDLRDRLELGPRGIRIREQTVIQLRQVLAKAGDDARGVRMAADERQLSLKSGEAKVEDLKSKLNSAASNREYQALKEQIAACEMTNSVLADEILDALEKIDDFDAVATDATDHLAKAEATLEAVRRSVNDERKSIEAETRRVAAELQHAEAGLSVDFRQLYERIVKVKGADAMAVVEGETCGGCHQQITPNMFSSLLQGRAVACKTCGRWLFLPEDRRPGSA